MLKQKRLWLGRFRRVSAATSSKISKRGFRIPGSGDFMRFTVWTLPLVYALYGVFNPLSPIIGSAAESYRMTGLAGFAFWSGTLLLGYLAIYPWRYGIWLTPDHLVIRSWFRVHRIAREDVQVVHYVPYGGMMMQFVAIYKVAMVVLELKEPSTGASTVKEFQGTVSGAAQSALTRFAIERWRNRPA